MKTNLKNLPQVNRLNRVGCFILGFIETSSLMKKYAITLNQGEKELKRSKQLSFNDKISYDLDINKLKKNN